MADNTPEELRHDEVDPPEDTIDTAELDPFDEAMVILLAQGLTRADVADTLGTTTKTLQRHLKKEGVQSRLTELRRERLAALTNRLIVLSDDAIDVIQQVMHGESDGLRLQAADKVLRLGRKHHKEESIESELRARMEAIERLLEGDETEDR